MAVRRVATFDAVAEEFTRRAHTMVWCNVATVDARGRPRSRVLHPIWEGTTGWIGTRRESPKARHLAANPYVSLAYVSDVAAPAYAECVAEWVDDSATKERIWDLFKAAPAPLGYDPAPIFGDLPGFGLLKLTPWRVQLLEAPATQVVWESELKPERRPDPGVDRQ